MDSSHLVITLVDECFFPVRRDLSTFHCSVTSLDCHIAHPRHTNLMVERLPVHNDFLSRNVATDTSTGGLTVRRQASKTSIRYRYFKDITGAAGWPTLQQALHHNERVSGWLLNSMHFLEALHLQIQLSSTYSFMFRQCYELVTTFGRGRVCQNQAQPLSH